VASHCGQRYLVKTVTVMAFLRLTDVSVSG
jgi:hypothetical protein